MVLKIIKQAQTLKAPAALFSAFQKTACKWPAKYLRRKRVAGLQDRARHGRSIALGARSRLRMKKPPGVATGRLEQIINA